MSDLMIKSECYNNAALTLRKDIAALLNAVWPGMDDAQCSGHNEPPATHRAALSAQSFCCYCGNLLVGYAAVVRKEILHCGHKFMLAGLSCVATHPDYRGCGIGSRVVSAATEYIALQNEIDIGMFTCHSDLAAFYKHAGNWEISPKTILVGSHDAQALSSQNLDVVVLMRLFSDRAQRHQALFCKAPISLDFPIGEFI